MKIAIYSHYFLPEIGAPSARIGDFARQWLAMGHEVHVGTCFPNHPTGEVYPGYRSSSYAHERLQGIDVHRSWTYITPNKGFLKKIMGHASFWLSAALFSSRKIPPVDCVIGSSPTFFAAMAARAKARRDGVPFIMEVRDLWPAIFVELGVIRNRRIIRLLELWEISLYRSATRIVTVTDSFRENLIARGVPARKVVTITNGADTEYWRRDHADGSKLRDGLKLESSFVVLYIGAHGISQGLGALIKAAARLKSRRDIRFVFVGEGADKPKLEVEAARLELTNVTFLPPVGKEAVRAYYSLADLCVIPLRNIPLFDTFIPSKMFEIMATGRPILASLSGEAADILGRSGAAQIVKPEDDAAIAAAIVEAAANPQLLEAMAKCGPNFVRTHYARSLLADRYLNLIQEAREEMGLTV
jgi:glycosyltransferase involved in cell wall biosynthesis